VVAVHGGLVAGRARISAATGEVRRDEVLILNC
jgi:hypothetical protein